jgi:Ca2+-binding EF-hand superfamily protein
VLPALVTALLLLVAAAPGQPVRAGDELQRYQEQLQQLFRRLDSDGDGRLTLEEARANAYLRRHFERLDRGGKGYLLPSDLR